ncbi:SRPBCC family protein [Lutimonas halocynthiae]|uniref:SRPBCC family protein n=1 Tax=Lutimonas halocynthiae TaxID=1446477 RepID=UPI0025B3536C|nr:SRPBCC family protein [Lutimonas halocynthiae]MDN3644058.1 SRPBCC family protein [Lutimonas halocynthiae]
MDFEKQGQIYQLSAKINLPISVNEAWDFLSNPDNLKIITPGYMGFNIISTGGGDMFPGQIISYKVSPLLGLKLNWVTEITYVDDMVYFVDEQRIGPYALWHHKHFVKEINGGTEMIDIVHYQLPFPLLANRFHGLLVKPKLKEIFNYRTNKLIELFGKYE